jgi:hypothetical protein
MTDGAEILYRNIGECRHGRGYSSKKEASAKEIQLAIKLN